MVDKIAKTLNKNFIDLLPSECLVQNNTDQKGGMAVQNFGTINNLSEKLIEQYELRLQDKDVIIAGKDEVIASLKTQIKTLAK